MTGITWEMTYSVETDASPAFAWNWWTDIAHWDDPPAEFELEGPFAVGARGTTRLPGLKQMRWRIREVIPPNTATIEMQLDGATLSFAWRFEGLADGRTRLTQRVLLQGQNAAAYLSEVKVTFSSSLPEGMKKGARAMTNANVSGRSTG